GCLAGRNGRVRRAERIGSQRAQGHRRVLRMAENTRSGDQTGSENESCRRFGEEGGVHVAYCKFRTLRPRWRRSCGASRARKRTVTDSIETLLRPFQGRPDQFEAEFTELFYVRGRRRIGHQLLRLLVLGESDHFPDRFLAGRQHDHAIEPVREAAVWRRAVTERRQKESKTLFCLLA